MDGGDVIYPLPQEQHRDPSAPEPVDELLMEGHLRVTRELLTFLTAEQKASDPPCASHYGKTLLD